MFRYGAVFLLIFGLVLGLWIGLDPQLRHEALQSWEHVKAVFVEAGVKFQAWIDGLVAPDPDVDPPVFSWERFAENLSKLWELVKLGLSRITVQVRTP